MLTFVPNVAGDLEIELRNVQLEGAAPMPVSDFASTLSSSFGTSWFSYGVMGSTIATQVVATDAACTQHAVALSGTGRIGGYIGFGLPLSTATGGTADVSAYAGISFDVRARARVWLQADSPTTHAPVQTRNAGCPADVSGAPMTTCAVGQGIAIPPYTTADLGAFASGAAPWTAGAQLDENLLAACQLPPDLQTTLPPALGYPAHRRRSHPRRRSFLSIPPAPATLAVMPRRAMRPGMPARPDRQPGTAPVVAGAATCRLAAAEAGGYSGWRSCCCCAGGVDM